MYLVNSNIYYFAFVGYLWGFLLLLGGKHRRHPDDRQRYLSGKKPNGAQGHGPHLDLLEGLGLGRVSRLADVDILGSEAFWVKFEVLLKSHAQ